MPSVKVFLKKYFMRTGNRAYENRSFSVDNISSSLEGTSSTIAAIATEREGESGSISHPAPDIDNDDPEKMHLRLPRKIGWFERRFTRLKHFWRPELTPMEIEQREQILKSKRIYAVMVRQMMVANKRIPQAYANLGLEYIRVNRTNDKYERSKPKRVHFCKWLFSADGNTIYGKVDSVPYGINPAKLVEDVVLTALTVSMGHPIGGRLDPNGGGVIISIALAGTMDIDDMFSFNKGLELISTSAPPLTYMVGATANGGRKTYNLEEFPHLLMAGTTGSGKSVALRGIAATFVARNRPEDVKLLMADLKRMDLVHFEGIPHLVTEIPEIPTGIVIEDCQIVPMLKWLEKENNRRQKMFAGAKVHDLASWNRRNRNARLPRIVVFIDELARLMRNSSTSKEFISMTYDLASTARAVGIYLVAATQFAKDKYITTDIKMNFSGRMCFSVPDLQASCCMIENGEAVNLYPPPGRGIFVHGVNRYKFQAPFISDGQLAEIVRNAKAGKTSGHLAASTELTYDEIVKWSLTENNGFLGLREAGREFNGRMEWVELQKFMASMEGKEYLYGGILYQVTPGGSHKARKLERSAIQPDPSTLPPDQDAVPAPCLDEPAFEAFTGECPKCGATRTQTPCEFCGSTVTS
jgi:hypothetical protein